MLNFLLRLLMKDSQNTDVRSYHSKKNGTEDKSYDLSSVPFEIEILDFCVFHDLCHDCCLFAQGSCVFHSPFIVHLAGTIAWIPESCSCINARTAVAHSNSLCVVEIYNRLQCKFLSTISGSSDDDR